VLRIPSIFVINLVFLFRVVVSCDFKLTNTSSRMETADLTVYVSRIRDGPDARGAQKLRPFKTPGSSVLSGDSATMTREHWRTNLWRRQKRHREPPFKQARASMCGAETARFAAGAPSGDAHIWTVVSRSNDSRNWQAPQRRGGGDTRHFFPAHRRACLFKGGSSVAVLPRPQLRTPLCARHCRRFPTQNRAFRRL